MYIYSIYYVLLLSINFNSIQFTSLPHSCSFSFLTMMSLCKKSVHSFLGFYNSKDSRLSPVFSKHNPQGLTYFSVDRPANMVESAAIKKSPPPTMTATSKRLTGAIASTELHSPTSIKNMSEVRHEPPSTITTTGEIYDKISPQLSPFVASTTSDILALTAKRDPGSAGFNNRVGGSVDGLMTCTEVLGFESTDERVVVDIDKLFNTSELPPPSMLSSSKPKKTIPLQKKVKNFPPLSSLTDNGQPKFFLRPVRKDGRLELISEVKTEPSEFLHVSRQDGRLRLQFVSDRDNHEEEDGYQEEGSKALVVQSEKEEKFGELEEEKWKIPATVGGGDGFRRCYELVTSHQGRYSHQQHNIWSQQRCVTIN